MPRRWVEVVPWALGAAVLGSGVGGALAGQALAGTGPVPARRIGASALLVGLLYAVGRAYVGPAADVRPYLTLPSSRRRLAVLLVGRELLAPHTTVVAAAVVGLWGAAVVPALAWTGSVGHVLGLMAMLGAGAHLGALLRRPVSAHPVLTVVVLTIILGLVAAGTLTVIPASLWLFDGLVQGCPAALVAATGGYGAALAGHLWWRRATLGLDDQWRGREAPHSTRDRPPGSSSARKARSAEGASGGSGAAGTEFPDPAAPEPGVPADRPHHRRSGLARWGRLGALVATELRLLRRNRAPRRLGLLLFMPLFLALLGAVAGADSAPPAYNWLHVLFLTAATGVWAAEYGASLFGWTGRQLEGVLARGVGPYDLLRAKLIVLAGGVVLFGLAPLPVLLPVWNGVTALHAATFVFVLGWGVPAVVWTACQDARPVALNGGGWADLTRLRTSLVGTAAVFGPALAPLLWASGWQGHAWSVVGIGLLSMAAAPLWGRLLRTAWDRRRYDLLRGVRDADS